MMQEKVQELADLLLETGKAHHQAYLATDGDDPEWPLWYADYLFGRLAPSLAANMTKSELVYVLVRLNKQQPEVAPDEPWWQFYAHYLIKHYDGQA